MFEVKVKDIVIKINSEGKDKFWFNVENTTGGTCNRPYGFMSINELKDLKNGINKLIRENKTK